MRTTRRARRLTHFGFCLCTLSSGLLAQSQGPQPSTCQNFPGAPPVSGDTMYFEQLGTFANGDAKDYIVIPVQFLGEPLAPAMSESYLGLFEQELTEALVLNSYGRLEIAITRIWPPVELPQTKDFYSQPGNGRYLRPDMLVAANAVLPVGTTVEDDFDREIVFHSKLANPVAIGQRTAYLIAGRTGYTGAHEIGHTFRWDHANFLDDPLPALPKPFPAPGPANQVEYGDRFDIMGEGFAFHHFNPWYKTRVGWLVESAGEVETVPVDVANGPGEFYEYRIRRLDLPPDPTVGPTAVRVPRDDQTDAWVFYRGGAGPSGGGVVITWSSRTNVKPSYLLDMTPGSLPGSVCVGGVEPGCEGGKVFPNDYLDADLAPGAFSVKDDGGPLRFRCTDVTDEYADVWVRVPQPLILDEVPVVDVISPAPGVAVGGSVTYEATAFDPDCGPNPRNGRGIQKVRFQLVQISDALTAILRSGGTIPANKSCVDKTDFAPPYRVTVNTTDHGTLCSTNPVLDNHYALVVTATSADGGSNRVAFSHVISNSGPSN